MSRALDFDIGPLTWVKGEIDQALERALTSLRAFALAPAETAQVKSALTHFHQAHGALAIVGLDGVTRVSEEIEAFIGDLERNAGAPAGDAVAAVERAIGELSAYLAGLLGGGANQPLKLYPVYRELALARGREAPDAVDLYHPDLSPRPPRRDKTPVAVAGSAAERHYREQRGRYQRGLLRLIRKDASGAEDMRAAVAAIEAAQATPAHRAFWWVALGFFDAVIAHALPDEPRVQRVCNRIEQQMKRLIEGSPTVAERLMRETLYQVARARPATAHLKEVQETYRLTGSVPESLERAPARAASPAAIAAMRELLAAAKSSWTKVTGGHVAGHASFQEQTRGIAGQAAALGNDDVRKLADALAEAGNAFAAYPERLADAGAMEVATALLLLENAVERFDALAPELEAQAEEMSQRLAACARGEAPSAAPRVPLLDENARRAQERQLMAQVVAEVRASLRSIEQALDAFFREPDKRGELAALDKPVKQVQGALVILNEPRAAAVLGECGERIRGFAGPEYVPQAEDFESIAAALSGLGFYVDALEHGKADFDAAMQPLAPARAAPVEESGAVPVPVASVESELAHAKKQVAALLDGWRQSPQDARLAGDLAATLRAIHKDAALVADARLEQQSADALARLERVAEGEHAELVELLAQIAGVPLAPAAPSEATAKLAESNAQTIDAELLAIFLEEATEVLDSIRTNLAAARSQPQAIEVLRTVRRGFHTLKGSGRMVGLRRLGEGAWAIEQVMNRWLEEERPATPDLFALVDFARAYFARAIDRLKAGGATPDEQPLVAAAEKLKRGEPLGTLELSPAAPAAAANADFAAAASTPAKSEAPAVAAGAAVDAGAAASAEPATPLGGPSALADALDFVAAAPAASDAIDASPAAEMPSLDFSMPMPMPVPVPGPGVPADAGMAAAEASRPEPEAAVPAGEAEEPPSLDFSMPLPSPLVIVEEAPAPAAAAPGSAPPTPQTPETPEPAEEVVRLGEAELSPTLFSVFVSEANSHLGVLAEEAVALTRGEPVSQKLQRGAHTLAGIAGTVRVLPLHELAHVLELAMTRMGGQPVTAEVGTLVSECVAELDRMAAAVRELRMPEPAETLVARLEELGTVEAARPSSEPSVAGVARESASDSSPSTAPVTAVEPLHAAPVLPENETVAASGELPTPLVATPAESAVAACPATAAEPAVIIDPLPNDRRQRRIDDDLDPELLPIFLEEAAELIPAVGQALRDWRVHPDNAAIGHALQRSLHTLKGSARMCGAMSLGELTHSMESKIENALALSALPMTLLDELETSYDRMHVLHERLLNPQAAMSEPEPDAPTAEVAIAEIEEAAPPTTDLAAAPPVEGRGRSAPAVSAPAARPAVPVTAPGEAPAAPPDSGEAAARAMLRVRADMIDRLVNEAGEIAIARSRIDGEMRTLKAALGDLTENVTRLRGQLREIEIQAESQMASRLTVTQEGETSFDPLEFDRFTRFQELTRMMAESVNDVQTVHQNIIRTLDESDAALSAQARLNRELQQSLMRIRMVPFQSVAERLYRVVRQAAKELDKRAVLDIRGAQVELDRSVLERITAPFEHLLRNSVAHGIEKPAERVAAGKKELGEIRIELRQEGNEVMMAVSDDGAGINLERVRAKAQALGLVEPGVPLTDKEITECIFHSGFSTASEVSQIAGRGVGMDVVKNEVQALGGRVEVATEHGKGARFTIYLPLTLAVTQAVLVRAGRAIYAIPSALVEQVRQLKEAELAALRETGVAAWQERHYGFRYLPRLLGDATFVPEKKRLTPVLYARSGANGVALQLDEVVGNQEIVVKNAGPLLSRIAGITGATVLGSGRIVLILNPVILADREPVVTEVPVVPGAPAEPEATLPTVMIVDDSLTVRKIAGRLLSREGYNVVTAKDGVDAMEQLHDLVPDVMLVDIEMPRMDGFDLTRNVRNDRRLKHVPIIMITSRTAEKHRMMAKEIGVDVFLGKPYQEEELLAHIAGFVKRPVAA